MDFRSDDGQLDPLLFDLSRQRGIIFEQARLRTQWGCEGEDSWIPRIAIDGVSLPPKCMDEGVLSPSRADDENFQETPSAILRIRIAAKAAFCGLIAVRVGTLLGICKVE